MEWQPIGTVVSPVHEAVDEGWGQVVSEIHLRPELARGLLGLDRFSHALVLTWLHEASWDVAEHLVRRPQGRDDMPAVGIFSQRARHRPNPIGVTAVEIVAVAGNVFTVRGLDAIDGTPVLDVKPYFPAYDRVDAAATPEWVDRLMGGYF